MPIAALRALRGVLDNDDALLCGLIVMHPLKPVQARNFHQFMASSGDLEVNGIYYPRMQILSIPEILEGQRFKIPSLPRGRLSSDQLEITL